MKLDFADFVKGSRIMQLHQGSSVVICFLLCTSTVLGYGGTEEASWQHEMTSSASFLITQKEAGTGLDDANMAHLTDSIQGLFDAEAVPPAANAAKTSKKTPAAPKVQKVVAKP